MLNIPQHTLPFSTTSAHTPVRAFDDPASPLRWQQHFGQAFDTAARPVAPPAQGGAAPELPPQGTGRPVRESGVRTTSSADALRWSESADGAGGLASSGGVAVATACRQRFAPSTNGNAASAHPARSSLAVPRAQAAPEMHVHLEGSATAVSVWIGAPGPHLVPSLVASIQRELQAAGRRLDRLVCNGATVYSAPAGKEKP